MRRALLSFCLMATLSVLSACAPEPAPEPAAEPEPVAAAEPAAPAEPGDPSGTWAGDWGPSASDRNDITLELAWDGMSLTGTINEGTDAIEIADATFDPETGAITMEFDGGGFHYTIEGQVDANSMTGSWGHDDRAGDFSITRGD